MCSSSPSNDSSVRRLAMQMIRPNVVRGQHFQTRFLLASAVLIAILAAGAVGYAVIEGMSWIDALYMTVITLSTVGFGEVQPLSEAGWVFTIVLIVAGVSALGYAAASIVEYFVGGHWTARFARRRKEQALANLAGHFIVCGYGRVGSEIAANLRDEGRQVVIIDADESQYQRSEVDGMLALRGDAASSAVLRKAGIERAAGILVATGGDAENVYTVLAARMLAPQVPVVARASTPEAVERLLAAGAARVFSPHAEGAQSMVSYMLRPRVEEVVSELLDPRSKGLTIEEVRVRPESWLVGRAVGELDISERYQVALVAITGDRPQDVIPSAATALKPNDVLIVVGRPVNVQRFAADCVGATSPPREAGKAEA